MGWSCIGIGHSSAHPDSCVCNQTPEGNKQEAKQFMISIMNSSKKKKKKKKKKENDEGPWKK